MGKAGKIVLFIASIWPIVYTILFFISFLFAWHNTTATNPPSFPIFGSFAVLFTFHIVTMLEIIVLLVIYIRNVFKNKDVPQDKRTLWAVILFFGSIIAMPIYWYFYIWQNPSVSSSTTSK
ncbi:MAG: hypothetical protein KGJ13_00270 [Patescibacteria group bacterium]|nr:hypothetical protein [Patescibacteria group bacterium]